MFDENPKIVEIDTIKPRSRSRRINATRTDFGGDLMMQEANVSPLSCQFWSQNSGSESGYYPDYEWYYPGDECRFPTTHNTPRLGNAMRPNAPMTPSKSVCGGDSYLRASSYMNSPNYMSNTKSFKAKLRSLSAPKQRPEPGSKKKLSLLEMMAARNSISGVRMQRTYA